MSEYRFFSCINCAHSEPAPNRMWRRCRHPAFENAGLVGNTLDTFKPEDWVKINFIINEILKLQVTVIDGTVSNFDFPFKYEPSWIFGCAEYKQGVKMKGKELKIANKIYQDMVDKAKNG